MIFQFHQDRNPQEQGGISIRGIKQGQCFVLSLEENAPDNVCPLASGSLLFLIPNPHSASQGVLFLWGGEVFFDPFGWRKTFLKKRAVVCLSLGNTEDVIIVTNDHRSGIDVSSG